MNKPYEEMSIEEIDVLLLQLGARKDQVRAEMQKLSKVRDKKVAAKSLAEKIGRMNEHELRLLQGHQNVELTGIPPTSQVGKI